jgi:signal peptidase II
MAKKLLVPAIIFFSIILIDQASKLWVKTHMMEGQEMHLIQDKAIIHFVENPGMAFSLELPGKFGKILLSVFRIIAIGFLFYLLIDFIKKDKHKGLIYCGAAILAGALGNLIDSAFYGLIFTDSYFRVAEMFPEKGYAGFLEGYVVDMLWFPIIRGNTPSWSPIWANEPFEFFRPVFNIADTAITVSVFIIIIFQQKFFPADEEGASETQVQDLKSDVQ